MRERTKSMSSTDANKLTYRHYVCFPDDGQRHEVIDGDHYVNPAPTTYHQSVLQRILVQLFNSVELAGYGRVFPAPTDVHLSEYDIVQPDIVVISKANLPMITPAKVKGVPDLLIEVVSPSSVKNDHDLKRQLYQRVGVGEYWIVELDEQFVMQLVLGDEGYEEVQHGNTVASHVIPEAVVDLSQVW